MKPRKYRNRLTVVDGIRFDSKAEARRWAELKLLEKTGKIAVIRRQVSFRLIVKGIKISKYVADFVYWDHYKDRDIVEDVTSAATAKLPLFKLKAKLMKACHGIDITVVQ